MKPIGEFLSYLRNNKVKIWLEQDKLRYKLPKGDSKLIVAQMKERKDELLEFLQKASQASIISTIEPINRDGNLSLSFVQQRMWFFCELENQTAYNMSTVLKIKGDFSANIFEKALVEIVKRHEVLRTTFPVRDDSPCAVVSFSDDVDIHIEDFSHAESFSCGKILDKIKEITTQHISLKTGPLFQVTILQVKDDAHIVLFHTHHIISDYWSMGILIHELDIFYRGFLQQQTPDLPDLPIQYIDFAHWQRETFSAKQKNLLDYWKQQLQKPLPTLELVSEKQRSDAMSFDGDNSKCSLPKELVSRVKNFANDNGVTVFMLMLTVFKVLLYRCSGQKDIIVGTPIDGRNHSETEGLIGCFLNLVAIRTPWSQTPSFQEILLQVQKTTLGAYAHQEIPFEKIVAEIQPERKRNRHLIFDVLFDFFNTSQDKIELADLDVELWNDFLEPQAKFSLTLYVEDKGDEILLDLLYQRDLHSKKDMDLFVERYVCLLGQVLEYNKSIDSYEIPTLKSDTLDLSTLLPETFYEPITQTFCDVVANMPEAIAITHLQQKWSYQQLGEAAYSIASVLVQKGFSKQRIILVGETSFGLIAGMMGVFVSGNVLVTLDKKLPQARMELVTKECAAVCIVYVGDSLREQILNSLPIIQVLSQTGNIVNCEIDKQNLPSVSPEDPAYVFFTSGTTGIPKGVLGQHSGLAHFITWQRNTFNILPEDKVAQVTGLSFDVVLREILLPLTSGATLCLINEEDKLSGEKMFSWFKEQQITLLHTVPSLAKTWLASTPAENIIASLRICFFAGEPLTSDLIHKWKSFFVKTTIVNLYGPSETTLAKCYYIVPEIVESGIQPIGQPLPETQIIIMSPDNKVCVTDEPGEIVIRTPFRTQGYINSPTDKFIANPHTNNTDDLLYYTGDGGVYRQSGFIDILGRLDRQVKINGIRIEPAEISSILEKHPNVKECVVIAKENDRGDKQLYAYLVCSERLDLTMEWHNFLVQQLPEHMVPSVFIPIETLPLTPNGKIDYKALNMIEVEPEVVEQYATHLSSPTEEMLMAIWCDLLAKNHIDKEKSFFELGGHSLLAAQAVFRINNALATELPMHAIFEYPTITCLAKYVESLSNETPQIPQIEAIPRSDKLPLSFAQERIWFLNQLDEGLAYNMLATVMLEGTLDFSALQSSIRQIITRHEAIRTNFVIVANQPTQVISEKFKLEIPIVNLQELSEKDQWITIEELTAKEVKKPFDLTKDLLVRFTLIPLSAQKNIVLFTMHHIISDGWSVGVFIHEMNYFYKCSLQNTVSSLPKLPVQYADFAIWQKKLLAGETLTTQLKYWKNKLDGAPFFLELPTDYSRPPVQSSRGDTIYFTLNEAIAESVVKLSHHFDATPYMFLLSTFSILLSLYSNQEDIIIGSPVANRDQPEWQNLIGLFVNTLALRVDLTGEPNFEELLQRVRDTSLEAYRNQNVPFEKLVEELQPQRNLSHSPIFQVMFVLQSEHEELQLPQLTMNSIPVKSCTSKFDLYVSIEKHQEEFKGRFEYNTDLFAETTILQFIDVYKKLLQTIIINSQIKITRLLTYFEGEEKKSWNNTEMDYPKKSLHKLFEHQVDLTPEKIALVFENKELTYRELNSQANQLAHYLIANGVKCGTTIGICMKRSLEMIIALVAVQKTGCAYLPLDPSYPKERLSFMIQDSGAKFVITEENLIENISDITYIYLNHINTDSENTTNLNFDFANGLLYLIYTSGSTGNPKGVMVTHQNVVNFLTTIAQKIALEPVETFLAVTTISFDIAGLEIYLPLIHGHKLAVLSEEDAHDGMRLSEKIEETSATIMQATPATWQMLLDCGWQGNTSLKALCGGEELSSHLAASLLNRTKNLWNLYGPTETTIWSTILPVKIGENVSIGRPLGNTKTYILNRYLEPVLTGSIGELYIGGDGVANGYWQRPGLTAQKFIPSTEVNGERLYRTGDLARYLPDGNIQFLGRKDYQVKFHGFRIELGEIESALCEYPHINQAVVVVDQNGATKKLVAYIVSEKQEFEQQQCDSFLRTKLPQYMIPHMYIKMDSLPLTPNLKVNRALLPKPGKIEALYNFTPPETSEQQALAEIWKEVLELDKVGIHDDFFVLGGHSLLATQIISRIRQNCGCEVSVKIFFSAPTIAELAQYLLANDNTTATTKSPITRYPRDNNLYPLSFAQERLWFLEQLAPGNPFYNMFSAVEIKGPLQINIVEKSLNKILQRHEILRTNFKSKDGHVYQVISPQKSINLSIVDLRSYSAQEQQKECQKLCSQEAAQPFSLENDCLLRGCLLQLDTETHILLITMHHIVSDRWSIDVFIKEIVTLYKNYSQQQESSLVDLPVQYVDYTYWQREWLSGENLQKQWHYWKTNLTGANFTLDLPGDKLRPNIHTFRGADEKFHLDSELVQKLKVLSQESKVSLFMTLSSIFSILISRYTQQDDIVIGSPISNRTHQDIEPLIGFFVNTIVLRMDMSENPSFIDFLSKVQKTTLDAYDHQDLPFEKLVQELEPVRDMGRNPLVQVSFVLQNSPPVNIELDQLTIAEIEFERTSSRFDLEVHLWESQGCIEGFFLYYKDLFNSTTIKKMIECFKHLLKQIVASPHKKLSEYSISTTAKLHRECKVVPVKEEFAYRLFENQVMATPDAPALLFGSSQMTYQEVNNKANRLAHYLRLKGISEEDRVAIFIERSFDLVIAILAVQKAGGTYIPLNINDPQQRILFILENAQSKILLTQTKFAKDFASNVELFCVDDLQKIDCKDGNITASLKMEQLAYIIYTSGSTGTPKGVMISHRALFNYLNWCISEYKIREEGEIIPLHSSISFDATITALFPPLIAGKSIWIVPEKEEIETLAQILREKPNLGLVKITPSHLEALKEFTLGHSLNNLRFIVGGEALTKNHLSAFKNARIPIINEYGPTETTVGCSTYQVDWDNLVDNIPIGSAIHGMEVYILDKNLQLVPTGVRGEIYIAGIGLARGYLNNPSLSAAKFIPHPFSESPGERMYKTGDIAKYLPDGNIEYHGRTDSQVKIRGFRIELGEIQNTIMDFPTIKQSVVTVSKNAERKLTAYIVIDEENLSKESNKALEWQPVFDNSYLTPSTENLNFLGWTNSYNRLAIPQQEMEEWLDNTAQRILSHKPQKLLEIGCGTGLIVAKVASQCQEYFATDFSAEALRHAQQIKYSMELSHVNFKLQPAHITKDIPQNYFDTAVINSVVQYFPNAAYLQQVIENTLKSIKDKGTIFIGDVRNLASLEYFYISLEVYESSKSISCSELHNNILQRSKKEPELVIHPLFFVRLKDYFKEISHVEVLLKEGKNLNELNRFRYDVILHINSNKNILHGSCYSWQDNQLSKIKEILTNKKPEALCITQIPNARIHQESYISKQLQQQNMADSLENIMTHISQSIGIDPQIFWELQSEFPYTISVNLSLVNPDFYNVIFKRNDIEDHIVISEKITNENIALTNIPLQIAKHKKTIETLENHLQHALPQYMIPKDFIVVEKIPLTSNGKVDYKVLECLIADNNISQQNYFPPRNQIESNLVVIWQEILGLESVGIQDNFFDLGGHSLLAVQLMARIQQQFAKQIPLTSLFTATTIEKQALLIQHQQSYSFSPLVAIQPQGKNKPLFCVPGAGGNVLYFYPLSRYLGQEQPLYGLQALGLDGEQPAHSSIEKMAECYVREIKNMDNSGIYSLAGHSFGANVAFEIAQQLIREGSQVALVAVLDASAPSPQDQPLGMDWDDAKWMEMIAKSVEDLLEIKLDVRYNYLKYLAVDEQLNYLHNKLIDARWFPPQTNIKRLKGLIEVYRSNAQTMYVPQSFLPVHIELFATQSLCAKHGDDSSCGWNKYASNSVCYHEIAGDHLTMMTDPCVKVLAQKLKVLLRKEL